MSDYLHGAYGHNNVLDSRAAEAGAAAIVYIGTAPVHNVEGGAANVNKPILVRNIAEARKYFGYSDDYAAYTLCEAMHVHLEVRQVSPIILINVLNPTTNKKAQGGTVSLTPAGGVVTIAEASDIVLDSIVVKSGDVAKVKGTDYAVSYNSKKSTIVISELSAGALGTTALTITYDIVDASTVTNAQVIGASDGLGTNTGIYAVKNVYNLTGYVPAFIAAPGFSSIPEIHDALVANSKQINNHWDAYLFVDLPLTSSGVALTLDTVKTFKASNHYDQENETVYFPLVKGIDGVVYHLSVLAAANFQQLLLEQEGIPYRTASNTECELIENLYMGETNVGKVYDDDLINEKLNKNGIASATYTGGRWAIWGAHSANYDYDENDPVSASETNRMMLYYICNDFQTRRSIDVDQPLSMNDLNTIVSEEQSRLDALVNIGALTYGVCTLSAENLTDSDIVKGDFQIIFNVTTTPLVKSLTATVNWTDEGYRTYYETAA